MSKFNDSRLPLTINQAGEHYQGSGLTKTAIRRYVVRGEIRSVRIGNKYLVTIEAIEDFLNGSNTPSASSGQIRRVGEKFF